MLKSTCVSRQILQDQIHNGMEDMKRQCTTSSSFLWTPVQMCSFVTTQYYSMHLHCVKSVCSSQIEPINTKTNSKFKAYASVTNINESHHIHSAVHILHIPIKGLLHHIAKTADIVSSLSRKHVLHHQFTIANLQCHIHSYLSCL